MDYSNIEFPKSVKQYNKIEQQNNINTNVFSYEEKQAFPIYVSRKKKALCTHQRFQDVHVSRSKTSTQKTLLHVLFVIFSSKETLTDEKLTVS